MVRATKMAVLDMGRESVSNLCRRRQETEHINRGARIRVPPGNTTNRLPTA